MDYVSGRTLLAPNINGDYKLPRPHTAPLSEYALTTKLAH